MHNPKLPNIRMVLLPTVYEEFEVRSCIQAFKGNTNIYGPLRAPTYICAVWTYFLIILYVFPSLFLPKRHYHPLHH